MPTALRISGYRFYFYSHEPGEQAHVHIHYGSASAKVWLHDTTIARTIGFSTKDLDKLQRVVCEHQSALQKAWDAFCDA